MSDFVLGGVFGAVAATAVMYLLLKYIVRKAAEQFINQDFDELEAAILKAQEAAIADSEIPLYIELHENQVFCYREDTDEFVAQGQTLTDITEQFARRFGTRKGRINPSKDQYDQTLAWLQQQMKNENTNSI